jgi:hypothetical protein
VPGCAGGVRGYLARGAQRRQRSSHLIPPAAAQADEDDVPGGARKSPDCTQSFACEAVGQHR